MLSVYYMIRLISGKGMLKYGFLIHSFSVLFIHYGAWMSWSQSQLTSGEKQEIHWAGCQS